MCEDQTSGKEPESKEKLAAEEKGDVGETEVEKVKIFCYECVHVYEYEWRTFGG